MKPDPTCFYCAGTGLDPDGWHDCPVCMAEDEYDAWEDDSDEPGGYWVYIEDNWPDEEDED